MSWDMWKERR